MKIPSFSHSWIGRGFGSTLRAVVVLGFAISTTQIYTQVVFAENVKAGADGKAAKVTDSELKTVKALDEKYQKAGSVEMAVDKLVKLGLLGGERKSSGKLVLSGGRLRMELEGDEKSLLVINKKTYWAVTFPGPEFKDAPVQVITGDMGSKKSQQSQGMLSLLTQGGFLKFFHATGVQKSTDGNLVYSLEPQKQQTDFKRAQLTVTPDGKEIRALRYWDERDNETTMLFKSVKFGKKPGDSEFIYAPPANAEIMKM